MTIHKIQRNQSVVVPEIPNMCFLEFDPENRTIIFSGEMDEDLSVRFCHSFLMLSRSSGEINIVIAGSPGGSWDGSGLPLMELVSNSKNYINTYAIGGVSSSAAMLFIAGDSRIIGKNSYLMFHDGSIELSDNVNNLENVAKITKLMSTQTHSLLSEISGLRPPKFFQEKMKTEWYVFADTALDLKLATEIGTPMGM